MNEPVNAQQIRNKHFLTVAAEHFRIFKDESGCDTLEHMFTNGAFFRVSLDPEKDYRAELLNIKCNPNFADQLTWPLFTSDYPKVKSQTLLELFDEVLQLTDVLTESAPLHHEEITSEHIEELKEMLESTVKLWLNKNKIHPMLIKGDEHTFEEMFNLLRRDT